MGILVFHPSSIVHHPPSFSKAGLSAEEHPTSHERTRLDSRPARQVVREAGEWQVKAGIIVSKKLSAKATERNRLKRRLRAALARVLPELSGVHVVVLPTRRALDGTVSEFQEELVQLLDRSNIKNPRPRGVAEGGQISKIQS